MTWLNISYTVPSSGLPWKKERKELLQNITGRVNRGEIMALMGPSGSGKTTLLDILADRVSNGEITGDIRINGMNRNSDVSHNKNELQKVKQQKLHFRSIII